MVVRLSSNVVHEMLVTYDCSAVDMLFPFFKSPTGGNRAETYIGLQSTGTTYLGYRLMPSYYQMGQWSKYVTRGFVRIDAVSTNHNLKVSAFIKGGKKVIVLIHSGQASDSFTIPAGTYRAIRTQMSGTDPKERSETVLVQIDGILVIDHLHRAPDRSRRCRGGGPA